jgi:ABC-type multidrug transport system ATPase subunit
MIRAERLSKFHGGVRALTDVTFEVARGEAVAISAALGSAPSTLLRILATLLAPTSGRLDIGGVDAIAAPFEARKKLFWSGTPAITSELSVAEYLELAGAGRGHHRLDPMRRAGILNRTGLDSADNPLSTLDAGRRRLVDLAAAVLSGAELILIDEPFGATAAPDRSAWLSLFAEARGQGATVVVATTNAVVSGSCDRLLSLEATRAA